MPRILVVDDNPDILEVLESLLSGEFAVESALSGEEALKMVRTGHSYDAIVCDLMMPGMTGMDFYKKVVEKFPKVEPRFLFMTGGSPSSLVGAFLEGRKHRVLEKPFEIGLLRKLLGSVAAKNE